MICLAHEKIFCEMKSILFISAFRISNKTAGQNYTLQLLQDLSKDFKIDIINWKSELGTNEVNLPDNIKIIKTYDVNSKLKNLFYSLLFLMFPLFTRRFDFTILKEIKNIANRYDYIYFDFSQVFIYSLFISHPRIIKMCHDVIGQKYSRKGMSFLFNWLTKYSEKRLLSKNDKILCFSDKDKIILQKYYDVNALPVSFYINPSIVNMDFSSLKRNENKFIFYGAWNRKENLDGLTWFFENVLPKCKTAQFEIIGSGIPDELRSYMLNYKNVKYLGFVENPYPIIASATALIAPIFQGAGVKVKVVESLALGIPVIGTEVAFEGISIPQDDVRSLYLVRTSEEYVNEIHNIRMDKEIQNSIRNIFIRNYSKTKFSDLIRSSKL